MKVKWSQLVFKLLFWLFAEIYLTVIGLDNLADYGEFVFQYRALLQMAEGSGTFNSSILLE